MIFKRISFEFYEIIYEEVKKLFPAYLESRKPPIGGLINVASEEFDKRNFNNKADKILKDRCKKSLAVYESLLKQNNYNKKILCVASWSLVAGIVAAVTGVISLIGLYINNSS